MKRNQQTKLKQARKDIRFGAPGQSLPQFFLDRVNEAHRKQPQRSTEHVMG